MGDIFREIQEHLHLIRIVLPPDAANLLRSGHRDPPIYDHQLPAAVLQLQLEPVQHPQVRHLILHAPDPAVTIVKKNGVIAPQAHRRLDIRKAVACDPRIRTAADPGLLPVQPFHLQGLLDLLPDFVQTKPRRKLRHARKLQQF